MSPDMIAYPFLFIAIFFESFVLVTLLSKPARATRAQGPGATTPTVAVIVPCYNEAATVAGTCDSLLALDYPKERLEIILVNDGSTDGTADAMARFNGHPQVRIIHKENGGKHTALNAGIAATRAEIIGCLDADSFIEPNALREIVPGFERPEVAATTAAMSVHRPNNFIEHMQNAEYIFGITLRHAIASVNGIYVTPGPFSFYRSSVIEKIGGFRRGHQTEDMEMALRIQRAGYTIENAPRARVYTKAPNTVAKLIKQRTRWTTGFLRNVLGEYRQLIVNRRYGALGMLVLPVALVAIASGILLFFFTLFTATRSIVAAFEIRVGIPLSYALVPHGPFNWMYFFPTSFILLLASVVLFASLFLMIVGQRLSRAPGNLVLGLVSYTFLYGFIAPLWLLRATADVAFGIQRRWR
ncbi:glycosyltransferase [Patescibacteria group bacterium]|nr:glycosyltransferase [Patescibacteria group bacterium]MDE2021796.1 glycosyltransferase family 2 protein [Patescibacteria group bacterium]MDE2173483.1 glycosyltransferase family 2 protein [Patescibacteria group bacterium]